MRNAAGHTPFYDQKPKTLVVNRSLISLVDVSVSFDRVQRFWRTDKRSRLILDLMAA